MYSDNISNQKDQFVWATYPFHSARISQQLLFGYWVLEVARSMPTYFENSMLRNMYVLEINSAQKNPDVRSEARILWSECSSNELASPGGPTLLIMKKLENLPTGIQTIPLPASNPIQDLWQGSLPHFACPCLTSTPCATIPSCWRPRRAHPSSPRTIFGTPLDLSSSLTSYAEGHLQFNKVNVRDPNLVFDWALKVGPNAVLSSMV